MGHLEKQPRHLSRQQLRDTMGRLFLNVWVGRGRRHTEFRSLKESRAQRSVSLRNTVLKLFQVSSP